MNGVAPSVKRSPPICRFFQNNGNCIYGDGCQFSHGGGGDVGPAKPPPPVPRPTPRFARPINNDPTPSEAYSVLVENRGDNGESGDSGDHTHDSAGRTWAGVPNDGFYPPPSFNGMPDFHQYRGKTPPMSQPSDAHAMPSFTGNGLHGGGGDDQLANQMVNMSLVGQPVQAKGRNPDASEFVPKTGPPPGPMNSSALIHSASTPSFMSYAHMAALGGPNALQSPAIQGVSPMGSPGISPQGSPLLLRRRDQSPAPMMKNSIPNSIGGGGDASNCQAQETVGGTTFFYNQKEMSQAPLHQGLTFPSFTVYPGSLPHMAHMRPRSNMPSFFVSDDIKREILNRQVLMYAQVDSRPDIPQEVDNYHNLFPLEQQPTNPMHKSNTFGYTTSCYRAINTKDGMPYCLRRIHGFRLTSTKCMALIDLWKKIQHSNIVQLREVFTTKAFNDHSMVFVYDYHPAAETVLSRYLSNVSQQDNSYNNPYNVAGGARPYSAGKGVNGPRHGLHPEPLIWSYIVQLTSALRTIHQNGLACRVMDPTKILLTDNGSRLRLNGLGIFDVLSFDANQSSPMAIIPPCQQEDLVSLGKVILALSCNSLMGIQPEHMRTSLDIVQRNYSNDLKHLIVYLLVGQNQVRSLNDIMPMIGARFYTQLDSSLMRSDALEECLSKEVENGRIFRAMCKLGVINERPDFSMDSTWSETGDRYMLKLFRDYLFHQTDPNGAPWIDMAHIVNCLNKLDAGIPKKKKVPTATLR